jgi:hypothetical protein
MISLLIDTKPPPNGGDANSSNNPAPNEANIGTNPQPNEAVLPPKEGEANIDKNMNSPVEGTGK